MPLLDQFRRPDRGSPPQSEHTKPPLEKAHTPASTSSTAVAEESLPNHASEEDAA